MLTDLPVLLIMPICGGTYHVLIPCFDSLSSFFLGDSTSMSRDRCCVGVQSIAVKGNRINSVAINVEVGKFAVVVFSINVQRTSMYTIMFTSL